MFWSLVVDQSRWCSKRKVGNYRADVLLTEARQGQSKQSCEPTQPPLGTTTTSQASKWVSPFPSRQVLISVGDVAIHLKHILQRMKIWFLRHLPQSVQFPRLGKGRKVEVTIPHSPIILQWKKSLIFKVGFGWIDGDVLLLKHFHLICVWFGLISVLLWIKVAN